MSQQSSNSKKAAHKINKTKQSLILGFAAIIGLMALLVVFRSNELEVTKDHIDKIGKNHLTKIDLIVQMRSAAHERTLALQRMLLQTDPFVRDEEWIRFNRYGAEFARARLRILSMQLTQREKTLLDYQGDVTKKAQVLQKRVIDLLNNDKFDQAREILLKSVIPIKEQVINQLNTFYHYQETEAEKIARDTGELYNQMRSLIWVVSAIALALGVAIAIYIVRRTANAENALTSAYASIQKQSAEKSQFLADVIDEYRSPLNSLMHYSDAIANNMRNDKSNSKDFLSDVIKIQNACHHLNGLTTEIIGLTNVEAGKDTLSAQDLDIREFVNDVADRFRPIAAKNNNQIEIQCPNNIGFMETDPTKLQQILFNLLANACKYTEFGLITLNVKFESTRGNTNGTGNRRWVTFSVIDTGIGIAPDKVDRIFNAIPNISRPINKHHEDSGLNLAISRRLCHMMGGDIIINSEPGMGSVFSVKLPFEANPVVA